MTTTPTDAEYAIGRAIGDCFVSSAVIAQALASQRAKYEQIADQLEADAQRADDAEPVTTDDLHRMITAARVNRHAAARIRRVAL